MHRIAAIFPLILCLGTAPASLAVELAEDHVGDVLIFPVFVTEKGWDTYINVYSASRTHTSRTDLSLRVVLRETENGEIIDHFNTYAPGDGGGGIWRAALFQDETGHTRLRVGEGECLIDSSGHAHSGPGAELPVAASVGLIEVYGMTHPRSQASSDCEQYAEHWSEQGKWTQDPSEGLAATERNRQISGEGVLINVGEGLSGVYAASALRDFADTPLLHTHPSSLHPNLADAAQGIDAVAREFNVSTLSNDVIVLEEVDASTDWIISYPTNGYHAIKPFDVRINGELRNCSSLGPPSQAGDPVAELDGETAMRILFSASGRDTEGSYGALDIAPIPSQEIGATLCNAVNVVSFWNKPSLLLPADSPLLYTLGEVTAGPASHVWWEPLGGSPLAFRLTRFVNGTLAGDSVLANYSFMAPHRRDVGVFD